MSTHEEGPVPYDEERMQRLSALYDRYCRQADADRTDSADRRHDATVPCKLAPAVLRRAASHQPQ